MTIIEEFRTKWRDNPVDTADLIALMKAIKEKWYEAVDAMIVAKGHATDGRQGNAIVSYAFDGAVSYKRQADTIASVLEDIDRLPHEEINNICFTSIRMLLNDQRRYRGAWFVKFAEIEQITDGSGWAIKDPVETAIAAGREAEEMTKLFSTGLEILWDQTFMPDAKDRILAKTEGLRKG